MSVLSFLSRLFLLSEQGGQEGKRDGLEDLDFYMGKDALEHSTTHQISYPIRHGLIEVDFPPWYGTVGTIVVAGLLSPTLYCRIQGLEGDIFILVCVAGCIGALLGMCRTAVLTDCCTFVLLTDRHGR